MIALIFNDPVLDQVSMTTDTPYKKRTGLICCHCHNEIRGQIFNMGNQFFDEYCWSLRFILEAQRKEQDRLTEMRKRMETGNNYSD